LSLEIALSPAFKEEVLKDRRFRRRI